MTNRFQSAREISKVYHALADREALQGFFLQSASSLLSADRSAIYYAGKDDKLWLESCENFSDELVPKLFAIAEGVQSSGKPYFYKDWLGLPLVTGTSCLGAVCFQALPGKAFSDEDCELGASIAMEFASALKSMRLLEDNLRMARLAAIGQTSSMVVHELKNILQLARLSEEMLEMGVKQNNTKFIQMGNQKIRHALKEMDGFIWEMLSLARDQKLETQKFPVADLFQELSVDLQTKAKASSAILKWTVPEGFPEVQADRKAVSRALLNLIKNAFEARKGDAITVTLSAESLDAETYQIKVEDNGQGMNEETRARLFQAFYTTKGERGTGLGLMVVEKTISLHRGKICVESTPGEGTRFLITLPFQPQSE
ncbi:MAG TPA: ATP-binding protein [Candidatus Omnitrophota bacterium]|nr:ATP-binding protein [Candidatus Omnitrophota bacterium]